MRLSRYISNLFLCFVFGLIALQTNAVDIVVKPVGLFYWNGIGSNDFESIDEAIANYNSRNLETYNRCIAAKNPGCSNEVVKKQVKYVRGILYDGMTYEVTAYYSDVSWPGFFSADYSQQSIFFRHECPEGFILRYQYVSPDKSIKNGAYCIKESLDLSSPPESCPVTFGNPVDVLTREKREHEIDYASADGILKLERFYVNQFVGWQYVAPTRLVDLTFDEPSSPVNRCYAGSLKANTTRKPYCFQYIKNPESTEKLVSIKTGKNNQYFFRKDANNNFTGTNVYTGQLTALTNSGYTWLHKQRDNTFDYYSFDGLLRLRKLPSGRQISYGYTNFILTSISDDTGRKILLNYDSENRISYAVLPDGNQISYEYDTYNNVTRVTWPDGSSKQYLYNEDDLITGESSPFYLTGKIDERGIRNGTYKYVNSTYPTIYVSTSQAGGVNKYTVSATGIVTNPLGVKTEYAYGMHVLADGTKLLRSQPQPAGSGCSESAKRFVYNSTGLKTQKTEFNGNITQYAYNSQNHENVRVEGLKTASSNYLLANATLPAGARKISTEWHPDWRVKTRIAEAKKLTTNIYNGQPDPFNSNQILNCAPASVTAPLLCKKVVQATTDANGAAGFAAVLDTTLAARVWQYTYNELGKTLTVSTPQSLLNNAVETTYEYYSYDSTNWRKGDLKQISNALGHTTQFTRYDANGRVLEMIDVNGVISQFTYDLRGRLLTATQGNATTQYTYDPVGNLIRVVQPAGATLEYDYDNASRLIRIRDLAGNKIEYALDKASNITAINYSDNASNLRYQQTRVYDALSRVQNIINASNNSSTLKYDASGNLTSEIDANNKTTSQTYDGLDQFKQRTDALNGKINYTFDAQGNLTSVKDQRNNTTAYVYNAFGELIEQNSPDTGKTSFNYNTAGNRISSTDSRGVIVNYSYDLLGRLTQISYPNASENVQFVYDNNSNNKGIGRLTSVIQNGTSMSYVYDDAGLIRKKIVTLNGITSNSEYQYDLSGNLTRIQYPSGRVVNYQYNAQGQMDSISTQLVGNSQTLLSNIQYLPFGPAQSYVYGNGLTHNQIYDQNYRLTAIQVGNILDRNYTYDPVSNINNITNNLDLAKSQTFTYDALNRLTSALGGYGNLAYTYDAVGNRLTESRNNTTDTYSYATTSNRLNSITRASGNRSFTYDNAGNPTQRTSDDNKTHNNTFNNANRLSNVNVNGSLAATYTYNALGQRVVKTLANGSKEIYHYDEAGQLLSVTDASGTTQREYIYFGNQQIAMYSNNNLYYIHNDHLSTPQVVTNQSQQVVWMGNYEPFGKLAANQTNSIEIFSRFPGQYFDAETNLYYNYFRDYDPSIGRYIESDPIGLGGGINTYAYAYQNPLKFVDPLGLDSIVTLQDVGGTFKDNGYGGYSESIQAWKEARAASWQVPLGEMGAGESAYLGPRDAVRHCVLACSLTQRLGRSAAVDILQRHEDNSNEKDEMDDRNNQMGCFIGENSDPGTCQQECLKNMDSLYTRRDSKGNVLSEPTPIGGR